MLNPGELRHRIILEQKGETRDGFGAVVETWTPIGNAWAKREPYSGGERWAADQILGTVNVRLTIRYRAGIVPTMRAREPIPLGGERMYDILWVGNVQGLNQALELYCIERNPEGA